MKLNKIIFVMVLSLTALLLSACSGSPTAVGAPSAVFSQDTLYVSGGVAMLAIRPDGTQIWRYPEKADANKMYYAPPLIINGVVVVGDYQNSQNVLYGLDATNGSEKWVFKDATDRFIASPVALGDKILAANADGHLYLVDQNGAKVKDWAFAAKAGIWATPVVNKNIIYVVSMDHKLYAVNAEDGNQIWASDLGASSLAAPVLGPDGMLYVATMGKKILAVEPEAGKIQWTFATQGAVWASPVLKDDTLYFGDEASKLYAINAKDGTVAWTGDAPGPVLVAPAITPNGLIYACETGDVLMVGFKNERSWTQKVASGKLYSSPVVADDRVIVPVHAGDALLLTYDLSGRPGWPFAAPK
jgi:outer membrane protein assembly factor BamB